MFTASDPPRKSEEIPEEDHNELTGKLPLLDAQKIKIVSLSDNNTKCSCIIC